jgi:hypothetical protein
MNWAVLLNVEDGEVVAESDEGRENVRLLAVRNNNWH